MILCMLGNKFNFYQQTFVTTLPAGQIEFALRILLARHDFFGHGVVEEEALRCETQGSGSFF